jgi:hypothetical protein
MPFRITYSLKTYSYVAYTIIITTITRRCRCLQYFDDYFTLFICDTQIIINNMKKKTGYSQEPHHYQKENKLMPYHQEDRMREDMFNSMGMPSFASQGTADQQYPT